MNSEAYTLEDIKRRNTDTTWGIDRRHVDWLIQECERLQAEYIPRDAVLRAMHTLAREVRIAHDGIIWLDRCEEILQAELSNSKVDFPKKEST